MTSESNAVALHIEDDGTATFNINVTITLFHRENNWKDLGYLEFSVYDRGIDTSLALMEAGKAGQTCGGRGQSSPVIEASVAMQKMHSQQSKRLLARSASMSHGGFGASSPRIDSGQVATGGLKTPRSPPTAPSAYVGERIWTGTLPVLEAVSNRVIDTKARKVHPRLTVSLRDASGSAQHEHSLSICVRVKRVLREGSVWARVFSEIRNVPLSQYFQKQQKKITKDLHERFHDKMDVLLLSRSVFRHLQGTFAAKDSQDKNEGAADEEEAPAAEYSQREAVDDERMAVMASSMQEMMATLSSMPKMMGTLHGITEEQRKHDDEIVALRCDMQSLLEATDVSNTTLSELAALRADMRELARAQGAIMAALEEQTDKQQQLFSLTHSLSLRSHQKQQQPQQQSAIGINGLDGASASSAGQSATNRTSPGDGSLHVDGAIVADMSRVAEAVKRESLRGKDGEALRQSQGSRWGSGGPSAAAGRSVRIISPRAVARDDDVFAAREGSMGRTNSDSEGTPTPGPPPPGSSILGRGEWDVQSREHSPDSAAGALRSADAAGGPGQGRPIDARSTPSTLYSKRSLVPHPAGRRPVAAAASPPPHIPKLPLTGSAWQMRQQEQEAYSKLSPRKNSPRKNGPAISEANAARSAAPSQLASHLREIHSNLQSNINQVVRPQPSPRSPPQHSPFSPRSVVTISSPATGKVWLRVACSCLCMFRPEVIQSDKKKDVCSRERTQIRATTN